MLLERQHLPCSENASLHLHCAFTYLYEKQFGKRELHKSPKHGRAAELVERKDVVELNEQSFQQNSQLNKHVGTEDKKQLKIQREKQSSLHAISKREATEDTYFSACVRSFILSKIVDLLGNNEQISPEKVFLGAQAISFQISVSQKSKHPQLCASLTWTCSKVLIFACQLLTLVWGQCLVEVERERC